MKRALVVAVVALVIGTWAGIRAWPPASVAVNKDTVIAIVLGVNLVLCLSVWYWARPRVGAVKAMPFVALLTFAMLLGILPRLFWPASDGVHIAGTVASLVVTTGLSVVQVRRIVREFRRRRSLRHGTGAV